MISVSLRTYRNISSGGQFLKQNTLYPFKGAGYRKSYFDSPSWDEVDRLQDIETDRKVEMIITLLIGFYLACMNVE